MTGWTDKYIGIPFLADGRGMDGLDCWGLVCQIYQQELGISIPSYDGVFNDSTPVKYIEIASLMTAQRNIWRKVKGRVNEFDMVSLRTGRHAFHVGIMIDAARFIHCDNPCGVTIETIASPLWRERVNEVVRHPSMEIYATATS